MIYSAADGADQKNFFMCVCCVVFLAKYEFKYCHLFRNLSSALYEVLYEEE